MKYKVMECHKGYAILMNEKSEIVRAANLNYETGQTVTDPVIMYDNKERISVKRIITYTAAAACTVLIAAGAAGYYQKNLKTQSIMTIDGNVKIEMALNSYGKVIEIHSDSEDVQKIIKKSNIKNKDSVEAVNEIIKLQKINGLISEGDTIDVCITSENAEKYLDYKSNIEEELSELSLNANVHTEKEIVRPKEETEKNELPVPPKEPEKPIEVRPHEEAEIPVPPVKHDNEINREAENNKPVVPQVPAADEKNEKPLIPDGKTEEKPPVPPAPKPPEEEPPMVPDEHEDVPPPPDAPEHKEIPPHHPGENLSVMLPIE